VFTTSTGKPIRHSNFYNRIWVPACERAGLDPRPGIHATRHSFASWLLSEPNVGLEAVQDQLGHESYDTTRKVYAHLLPAVGVAAGLAASAAMREVLAQRATAPPLALD
jgi:integrase